MEGDKDQGVGKVMGMDVGFWQGRRDLVVVCAGKRQLVAVGPCVMPEGVRGPVLALGA